MPNLIRAGGEMFNFHDRPGAGGPLPRYLISSSAGPGRAVLVAGPHPGDLVTALAGGGAEVTWVLRSLADAEAAAAAHPAVTVVAGAFGKIDIDARYDLVVALDGLGRLNSAEGDQLPAGDLLDRLAGAVRPGGVLILMHDNQLGFHHTVRLDPGHRYRDDAAWYPIDGPASRGQLADRLTGAGLAVDMTYAAFPEPSAPAVLIGGGVLGDVASPLRPWLMTVLAQACTTAYRGRPVLSDPRRLIRRALLAGAEDTVAGGWLVVAHAPGGTGPARTWHEVLADDVSGVCALDREGPRLLMPRDDQPGAGGSAGTEGSAGADGLRRAAVLRPSGGRPLEDLLLELCAVADVRGLRRELAGYESWLTAQATDGVIDGPAALADLSALAVTEAGPVLVAARWAKAVPVRIALVRALWQFAVRLITWGRPHPWPITASAADLAAILAGMVGHRLTDADVTAAIDLQVALDGADFGLGESSRRELRLALSAIRPGSAPVDVAGYHELAEALWRQRYEASHLLAMMAWTDDVIRMRDDQLSRMDWELQFYRSRLTGRALMTAKRALRMLRARSGRG